MSATKATAHDRELAMLRRVATPRSHVRRSAAQSPDDLIRCGYELARLVVELVERGQLKSTRGYALAKELIAAYEGGAA